MIERGISMTSVIYNPYNYSAIEILIGSVKAVTEYIREWIPYEHGVKSDMDGLLSKPFTQTFILSNIYCLDGGDPFYLEGNVPMKLQGVQSKELKIIRVSSVTEAVSIDRTLEQD